jgi:hypothetical protein
VRSLVPGIMPYPTVINDFPRCLKYFLIYLYSNCICLQCPNHDLVLNALSTCSFRANAGSPGPSVNHNLKQTKKGTRICRVPCMFQIKFIIVFPQFFKPVFQCIVIHRIFLKFEFFLPCCLKRFECDDCTIYVSEENL